MQTDPLTAGGTPRWRVGHLARVPRLIRLISEIKSNPRQSADT
jgi:hypothetical protein